MLPLLALSLAITAAAPGDAKCNLTSTDQVPFDVRANGDDGLTQRLAQTIVSVYASGCPTTHIFTGGRSYSALIVTIDSNVVVRTEGGRSRAYYSVSFQVNGKSKGLRRGSCWKDTLSACAAQIVRAAPAVSMA